MISNNYSGSDAQDDVGGDYENTNTPYPGERNEPRPDEIPEKHDSENENSEYPNEVEVEQQDQGDETGYSKGSDVTPPNPHEFPSVGRAETDFASRPQGRTTGRMVGHEPGTEGI